MIVYLLNYFCFCLFSQVAHTSARSMALCSPTHLPSEKYMPPRHNILMGQKKKEIIRQGKSPIIEPV